MRLVVLFCCIVITCTLIVSSCIVTSHDFDAQVSCDQFANNNHRSVDFEVEVGDKIRIELCSNPTTGFEWEYEISSTTVLREEDHDFEPPDSDLTGAAGVETWTFESTATGTSEIDMEYSQPWEGGEKSAWTYTITVTVE